jgi:hypothetical protein
MQEIRDAITTKVRLNAVVETGVPGFIPRDPAKAASHEPTPGTAAGDRR